MLNPWESVPLSDYENHMQLDEVHQLQVLNEIMREQIGQHPVPSVAILGVAGGNGLEHTGIPRIEQVYGIDINSEYLAACARKYAFLGSKLCLMQMDLADSTQCLPAVDLLIANLLIEYIGVEVFAVQIAKVFPRYVSCVIQANPDNRFVSASPYLHAFDGISALHRDVSPSTLADVMKRTGYDTIMRKKHPLPNGKYFLRLDFERI